MSDGVIAGRYRLIERLDSGGASEVYRAQDDNLNRTVAVKVLKAGYAQEQGFLDRFVAEARAGAELSHPNIVGILDWGQDAGSCYIVMEFVAGQTLRQLLDQRGALEMEQAIDIAEQVAAALAYAHDAGVTHENIRAEHVLLTAQAQVKLTDFGVARASIGAPDETQAVTGDTRYISPEQAQGRPTSPATDVYSLGVVLYQAVTGRLPFAGDTPVEVAMKHVREAPVPPRQVSPALPADLDRVILKAMAKDPAQRYASVREMALDLERVRRGLTPEAKSKSRVWMWVAGIVVALLAAALAFALVTTRASKIVPVPDLTGAPAAEATATLAQLKLVAAVQEIPSPTATAGTVMLQDPAAGRRVRQGSTVNLTVSAGKPTYPVGNYVGLPLSQALNKLVDDGFVAGDVTKEPNSNFPVDTVFKQDPAAGAKVAKGSKVDLVASSGQAKATVPGVTGLSESEATSKLKNGGFKVDTVDQYSTEPAGTVIDQTPDGGQETAKGATVTIYVSKGPQQVTVPRVIGMTEYSASAKLQGLGLSVVTGSTVVSDTAEAGIVQSQDPAEGTKVPSGSQVKIVVGSSP